MACFADIKVSQATDARCDGSFYIHLTTNLPVNFSIKSFLIGSDLTALWS